MNKFAAGWNRWSEDKRIRPFYRYAKRHNWIAADLMEQMPLPKVPVPERRIYTPDQFQELLWAGERQYPALLPFIVLSGFCFLRTSELVHRFASEQVLRQEHILWHEDLIHVPQGIAKSTRRREGDERYTPLTSAAKKWLKSVRQKTGDCVPYGSTHFGKLWRKMTDKAEVPRIDNGLRHSAISYSLAAYPEHGVALTAQWAGNSEATIKKHYRQRSA